MWFIPTLSRLLAALPLPLVRLKCQLLGECLFWAPTQRRRLLFSNLHHAFPEKPYTWHKKIAREHCRRVVEMGLLALALPAFSKKRLRRQFTLTERLRKTLDEDADCCQPPALVLVPHFSAMEALTVVPALYDGSLPRQMGAIFRPLDSPRLDRWIRRSRERWGVKLFSRKSGFQRAKSFLRQGGHIGLLFDQNARRHGVVAPFIGRLCSTTRLHGLLSERFRPRLYAFYPIRKGFWRAELDVEPLQASHESTSTILAANAWLENKLRQSDEICSDWLWLHDRWRIHSSPPHRLHLSSTIKDILEPAKAFYGYTCLPRKTRIWIRMPNWLGDVIMTFPLLRALRRGRPDAELTLLVQPALIPLLEELAIADHLLALPPRGIGYFRYFVKKRRGYPDTYILFTNSLRSDMEARLVGAPQRFGLQRPGKRRPFLTHTWRVPRSLDEATVHQTEVWRTFLGHFGLQTPPDFTPLQWPRAEPLPHLSAAPQPLCIGLICGTENDPCKRWPIDHWRTLIRSLLDLKASVELQLFGTANDRPITQTVAKGFPAAHVQDWAGRTDIRAFAHRLLQCALVICNDTGGMHLANALGVPVLVLFGPTNPVRTGPVFEAPRYRIQPPGCPPTGARPIADVTPSCVFEKVKEVLIKYAPKSKVPPPLNRNLSKFKSA